MEPKKELKVAGITVKRLAGGDVELAHPSGVVVIETEADRQQRRAALVADVTKAELELAAFDATDKAIRELAVSAALSEE